MTGENSASVDADIVDAEVLLARMRLEYEAGNLHAFYEALLKCYSLDLPPPRWTIFAAEEICFEPKRRVGRGRTASPVARYKQLMIDFSRWEAVRKIRERKTRPPWSETYEQARELLTGAASGAPATIKASYLRIQRLIAEGLLRRLPFLRDRADAVAHEPKEIVIEKAADSQA